MAKITTSLNNVTYSNSYDIMYGTAQGSCLGPLLFLIFCNDVHLLPLYGQIILFADDTNLFCSHCDRKFLEFMLKHDMELLTFWFRANQLSLNMGKTVLMTFWDTQNMNVIVDNTVILHVEQTKFLGVILDRQLTSRNHTNTLYNKIIANTLLLLKSKQFISNKGLKSIYYGYIHSHISYGLINWGSMADKGQIRKLRTAQNAHVRLLSNNQLKKLIVDLYVMHLQDHLLSCQLSGADIPRFPPNGEGMCLMEP